MATPLQLAERRYRANVALRRRVEREARRLWRRLERPSTHLTARFGGLDRGWREIGPQLVALLVVAQQESVRGSDAYVAAALAAQGIDADPVGQVNTSRLVGVASDGRPLDTLLYEPVIATKTAIGRGASTTQATTSGLSNLLMILGTQVTDAARAGDGLALTARPGGTGYVRMLNPPSCSRCAVLAGKWFRWNQGFLRHPRCDCRHIPTTENRGGELRTDPGAYFRSLTPEQQDRVFTKVGAQAIRDGADIGQVVNARRGMETAARAAGETGGRLTTRRVFGREIFTTTEGVTRRGVAGRRLAGSSRGVRLMPEQIYRDATSRDDAIRLLRRFGYII